MFSPLYPIFSNFKEVSLAQPTDGRPKVVSPLPPSAESASREVNQKPVPRSFLTDKKRLDNQQPNSPGKRSKDNPEEYRAPMASGSYLQHRVKKHESTSLSPETILNEEQRFHLEAAASKEAEPKDIDWVRAFTGFIPLCIAGGASIVFPLLFLPPAALIGGLVGGIHGTLGGKDSVERGMMKALGFARLPYVAMLKIIDWMDGFDESIPVDQMYTVRFNPFKSFESDTEEIEAQVKQTLQEGEQSLADLKVRIASLQEDQSETQLQTFFDEYHSAIHKKHPYLKDFITHLNNVPADGHTEYVKIQQAYKSSSLLDRGLDVDGEPSIPYKVFIAQLYNLNQELEELEELEYSKNYFLDLPEQMKLDEIQPWRFLESLRPLLKEALSLTFSKWDSLNEVIVVKGTAHEDASESATQSFDEDNIEITLEQSSDKTSSWSFEVLQNITEKTRSEDSKEVESVVVDGPVGNVSGEGEIINGSDEAGEEGARSDEGLANDEMARKYMQELLQKNRNNSEEGS